jgi:hypothetical protein
MPSIAMNSVGDIAMGYSVSSSTVSPSIRWTGRLAGDPAGQMTVAETSITEGSGSQTGYNRWGDYSALTVDPVDDCTFWYTNEYYPSSSSVGWHTRIGWFRTSDCGSPPPAVPAAPTGVIATALGGTNAGSISVGWNASTGATSYLVEKSTDGTTWDAGTPVSTTSYVATGLQPVTHYWFRVLARNTAGDSAPSGSADAVTSPTGLTGKTVSRTRIDLSWRGATSGVSYAVFRATGAGAFTQIASGLTTLTYSSTGLTRNTTYSFYVVSTASPARSNTATAKTKR